MEKDDVFVFKEIVLDRIKIDKQKIELHLNSSFMNGRHCEAVIIEDIIRKVFEEYLITKSKRSITNEENKN